MKVLYFAWLKERIGVGSEEIETAAVTAGELAAELAARGEGHAMAFSDLSAVRVAVDQEMGDLDTSITSAREVAFFPPVTGG
jgi:molybdopterin synthase sulfur carrier subunit